MYDKHRITKKNIIHQLHVVMLRCVEKSDLIRPLPSYRRSPDNFWYGPSHSPSGGSVGGRGPGRGMARGVQSAEGVDPGGRSADQFMGV